MKDTFETFIKEANNDTNKTLPEKEIIWNGIEQQLHRRNSKMIIIRLGIAAGILMLFGVGTAILTGGVNGGSKQGLEYCSEMSAELYETQFYFAGLIDEKKESIKKEGTIDKDIFQSYYDRLAKLDEQFAQYQNDLKNYGLQEELINAMIENQQEKLETLNNLLTQIQKIKSYENRKKNNQV